MGNFTKKGFTSKELEANKKLWNEKTAVHLQSDFYAVDAFKAGATSLKEIELREIGEVRGKSLLHLQCHFGQDTLSWARLGAEVTGVDLSDAAIDAAKSLSSELDIPANFVCSNVYDTRKHTQEKFDIVFTSYGTIGWLPDLDRWAEVIAQSLKNDGFFYIADFHPVIWMHDEKMEKISYSYFNDETIKEITEGSYTDRDAPIKNPSYSWNHPISEILNALIKQGLVIELFNEHPYSPWPCFDELEEVGPDRFVFKHLGHKIPYVYSIKARKSL
ncbi:MAG: class I SAM-dependent methyltransferase [Bacteroidota bacterium]